MAKAHVIMVKRTSKGDYNLEIMPLVLCQNCKYWVDNGAKSNHWLPCQDMSVPQEWFCASGESKDGDE